MMWKMKKKGGDGQMDDSAGVRGSEEPHTETATFHVQQYDEKKTDQCQQEPA